jgi:hypothetical protein
MANRYWVGGSGNWDGGTANWAATSGGSSGASAPTSADDVFFDVNSDSGATFTVTLTAIQTVRNLTVSGLDQSMVLAGSVALTVQGDITLPTTGSPMTWTHSGGLSITGTVDRTITTNGVTISSAVTFNPLGTAPVPVITLGSALTLATTRSITFTRGTVDFAGYNVTASGFISTGAVTRTLTLGSGTVTFVAAGNVWNLTGATGLTLDATNSTILLTAATSKTFVGNGLTYNIVKNAGAGAMVISGANTFGELGNTVQPTTVTLTSGLTQTVTTLSLQGTAGNLVTLNASTAGTAATLSKASGTVDVSYLSIKDNTPTGGARWVASNGTNVDGGNTVGWEFILGLQATGSIGTVTVTFGGGIDVSATSVSATGSIGNASVVGKATYAPTSVSATGFVGNESVVGKATYAPTSVSATGAVGTVVVASTGGVVTTATSVSAAGSIGIEVASGGATYTVPTGLSATGRVGSVSLSTGQTITATSVYATGYVSSVLIWGLIDTAQTAGWVEINT